MRDEALKEFAKLSKKLVDIAKDMLKEQLDANVLLDAAIHNLKKSVTKLEGIKKKSKP